MVDYSCRLFEPKSRHELQCQLEAMGPSFACALKENRKLLWDKEDSTGGAVVLTLMSRRRRRCQPEVATSLRLCVAAEAFNSNIANKLTMPPVAISTNAAVVV